MNNYFSLDWEKVIIEPDEDQLTRFIMDTEYNYWMRGRNDGGFKFIIDNSEEEKFSDNEFKLGVDHYII